MSAVAKNLIPFGGGLPSGFNNLAETSAGTSCGWQFNTQAACSAVKRAGNTRERWQYSVQDKAFDLIRHHKLIETSAEYFPNVLNKGSVSTNVYLRRAHNFPIGMHWLPWPVLPKLHWPPVKYKDKRAITLEEHQKIINRVRNPATRASFELL